MASIKISKENDGTNNWFHLTGYKKRKRDGAKTRGTNDPGLQATTAEVERLPTIRCNLRRSGTAEPWIIGSAYSILCSRSASRGAAPSDRCRSRHRYRFQVNFFCSGTGTSHSRHTISNAAMITGPRNKPSNPNVASPPKMPTNANRNGKRAAPPTSVGQTK